MPKHLFIVHGRHFKPAEPKLKGNWLAALRHGLQRDGFTESLVAYRRLYRKFVYYGDLSNQFLEPSQGRYDEEVDVTDRRNCLSRLKEYGRRAFLGRIGKGNYNGLPGVSSWKDNAADLLSTILEPAGLASWLIRQQARDIDQYWDPDTHFGSEVRWRLTEPLCKSLYDGHDVLLVAHSLGSMISYDVLWKFSYYGEYKCLRARVPKPLTFITLGSPLGDETVKRHLKGADAGAMRRYPFLIRSWDNVSAEDDYVAHDETLADDYKKMTRLPSVVSIKDHQIYNLAVRHGKSNPHHGVGYMIHPTVIRLIGRWLAR